MRVWNEFAEKYYARETFTENYTCLASADEILPMKNTNDPFLCVTHLLFIRTSIGDSLLAPVCIRYVVICFSLRQQQQQKPHEYDEMKKRIETSLFSKFLLVDVIY